jgi:hypothetical protein
VGGATAVRDRDELFAALAKSSFRRRFRLGRPERQYLQAKGMAAVLEHARKFLAERLAPAEPPNDGRQTPMRGHPAFIAQHATGTCCRSCLAKWHGIEKGRALSESELNYVVDVLRVWLQRQAAQAAFSPRNSAEAEIQRPLF